MSPKQTVPCPHCSKTADASPANPYRPFCSRRCRLIDLGDWLDESHRIPGPGNPAGPTEWPDDNPESRH